MAVPSSGQLRLRGDIALEVYGTATGSNISLRAMSNEAGFNVPDSMSEFYGYSSQTVPSVTTNAMSVGETTANLSGNVTSDGQSTITERGFYFGTNSASPTNNTKYVVSGTTGSFTNNRTGLTTTTTYYCWAYATNALGTTYGSRVQATTLAVFVPTYQNVNPSPESGFYTNLRVSNVYGGSVYAVHRLQYINPNTGSYIEYETKNGSVNGYQSLEYNQYPNQFGFGATICTNATNRMYVDMNQDAGSSGGVMQSFLRWRSISPKTYTSVSGSTDLTPITSISNYGGTTLNGSFSWYPPDDVSFPQPNNQFFQITFNYN
jgi:hypothetical protein